VHQCKLEGVRSLPSRDISVLGHLRPWAWLLCRILAGSCSRISTVSRVRFTFRVKVMVRDRYVKELKCPRTKVTIYQFAQIYPA